MDAVRETRSHGRVARRRSPALDAALQPSGLRIANAVACPHHASPAEMLSLQRTVGNRAVAALLAGRRNRPARPAVQRRPWLDDEEDGIYRDNTVDMDFAFVGTIGGSSNQGVFMAHANLAALRTWRSGWLVKPNADWITADPSGVKASQLKTAVGPLWVEVPGNRLSQVSADSWITSSGIVLHLITLGQLSGPILRREGGGSRLPTAEGTLYIEKMDDADDKDAVLRRIGIEEEKLRDYGDVKAVFLPAADEQLKTLGDARILAQVSGAPYYSGSGFVYISSVVARKAAGRRVVAKKQQFDENFTGLSVIQQQELEASYQSLRPPTTDTGWVEDLNGGREGSQSEAMGGWNALGAAAFHNRFHGGNVPLNQNWEWLHIRGAQIGGDTTAGNLMAGTFAANSTMIPYEAQLERWHQGHHGQISARFLARAKDAVLAEDIEVQVASRQHPELGSIDRDHPVSVRFDPLRDQVVDKLLGHLKGQSWREQSRLQGRHPTWGQLIPLGPERLLPGTGIPPHPGPVDAPREPDQRALALPGAGLFPGGITGFVMTESPTQRRLQGSLSDFLAQAPLFGGLPSFVDRVFDSVQRGGGEIVVRLPGGRQLFRGTGTGRERNEVLRRLEAMTERRGTKRRAEDELAREDQLKQPRLEDLMVVITFPLPALAGSSTPLALPDPSQRL